MNRWPLQKAYFWETAPFFRILLPFAVGMLSYEYTGLRFLPGMYSVGLAAVGCVIYGLLFYGKISGAVGRFAGFAVLQIMLISAGLSATHYGDIRNDASWFGHRVQGGGGYLARITEAPAEKASTWKLTVQVISLVKEGKVIPTTGNAFVYLYKDKQAMLLHKGDCILLPGNWQGIRNAGNPFEFDYAGYCRRNNLLYQQFCAASEINTYRTNNPDNTSVIERSHDWCMTQLDKYLPDAKAKGLMQAMLLGDEVNLDEELRQWYAETGIIHIIAISGGNVAIFFVVISFLLWWLKDRKHLWIKYAVAIPLVWFYVVMAGAPPSAVRAALMFSLLAGSIILQKNNNSLNTLFAAAFLLLCMQPMWLFSVGFQLSFVAVLSLILFYAPVYRWFSPANKVTNLLWSTIAASIAAEVLVAPLVIYYFHIFPLLFVVANAAAYLFMSLVLILGILVIGVSWWPVVAKGIGVGTVYLVAVFDHIVGWLQQFNPPSFHFLVVTGIELLMIYLIVAGFSLFLLKKQKAALFTALAACCIVCLLFCMDEWGSLHQRKMVVYNTGGANHIELIKGNTYAVLYTDTSLYKKTDYAVRPAHIGWRTTERNKVGSNQPFNIGGKTVLILNENISTASSFHVDDLILNYSGKPDVARLKRVFSPVMVVIGNNYSHKQQGKLVKKFADEGVKAHSITMDGAFVLE